MIMERSAPQKRMMLMKEKDSSEASEDEDDVDDLEDQEEMKESESYQIAAVNELAMAQAEAAPV